MEARLTAVVETKGAARANSELNKISRTAKVVDINVKKSEKSFKSLGKNASAAVAAIDGPLGGVSSRVSSLTTLLTSGTAAATGLGVSLAGLGFVLVSGIKNLDEYNVNLKRVNATIKATGDRVGFTGEALREEAEALALATLTSVSAVQKAQAELNTFNRVLGDEFIRATRLAQDLAEAGFGTIESNAVLLGKALQDPIKGMSALTRVGVTLSETQKQLAEDAVNTGDIFAAQGIILDAIAGQAEGVATAVADGTLAGALDTLGERWDDLTRVVASNLGILGVWTQIVRGAGVTAKLLTDALTDDTAEELFNDRFEATLRLNEELSKLESINDKNSNAYNRQANAVSRLRAEVSGYDEALKAAIKSESDRIEAAGEANRKESLARKEIEKEVLAEAEAKAQKEKEKEEEKLARKKAIAQRELETILALNNSELESIKAKENSRLEAIKESRANELITEQEFQAAKAEIELNASLSRQELRDKERKEQDEARKESVKLATDSIQTLSDDLLDAALSGKSLGDTVKASVLGISKTIIKAGVDQLIQEQLINKISTAAFVASKTAEVTSTVAQAGLNAFAATAAIPVVGPAAAPAAAAAATGAAASIGANVIALASAREQGGSLSAGQASTIAERGQLEVLTPSSSSRIRTKQQMQQLMGEGGSSTPQINIVNIDQSSGGVSIESTTDDDGRIIQIVRDTVASDAQNSNSQIRKSFASATTLEARR